MSTKVTVHPASETALVLALSFVGDPLDWLNCPNHRSMLAATVPPAPITVNRPATASPAPGA